ncbi:MAG: dipeptidase [Eubacteriales bacterium]
MKQYIDLQCVTITSAWKTLHSNLYELPKSSLDIARLRKNGCVAQNFAITMLPLPLKTRMGDIFPEDDYFINKCHGIFMETLTMHGDEVAYAGNAAEMLENERQGKLSAFLSLSDGRAVGGDFKKIRKFHKMGIRMMGLTWNLPNCFGSPASADPKHMAQGLTKFGKNAVEYMNELGMIIDVSHLSDKGFWDVASLSKKPFVASHSNARALSPHPRNLSDFMIKGVADSGGVVGVNFYPPFLCEDTTQMETTMDRVVDHIKHIIDKGGIECVAIGSDFDNYDTPTPVADVTQMPLFFETLEKAGLTEQEIENIAYNNMFRVIQKSMKS